MALRHLLFLAPALAAALTLGPLSGCNTRPRKPGSPSSGAAAGPVLRFRDVAGAAGVEFTPDPSLPSPMDILQTAGYGGGFLDFDGDGRLDVLQAGHPRCRLYRNTGDGRFQDATAAAGLELDGYWQGCASADYDNDGWPDLLLTGYHTAALLHNRKGRFERVPLPFPTGDWGTSAAFFDYDGDGWLDLYIGCYVRFGPDTPRLCPFGSVEAACTPSYYDPQRGHLYRNLAGKGFQETTAAAGLDATHGKTLGVAPVDYNGDGRVDLYLANDGMPGDLFTNRGGRFTEDGLASGTALDRDGKEQAGMGTDWGDVNGDARPDLVVATFQFFPDSLYVQGSSGSFREAAFPWGLGDPTAQRLGFGAKFFDADNDGLLDLLLANGHVQDVVARIHPDVSFAQPAQLFRGQADRFVEEAGPGTADLRKLVVGRAAAAGDYDNDGRLDLLITNLTGPPLLLHNETEGAGHWMTLSLRGRGDPRDGSGAVVTIRAGGRTLTRFAGTSGSYLACSDPRVHAGLGAATTADVTVRWPGGPSETWEDLVADRVQVLEQGKGRREKFTP